VIQYAQERECRLLVARGEPEVEIEMSKHLDLSRTVVLVGQTSRRIEADGRCGERRTRGCRLQGNYSV
jgi:hypothetical protein